jgi:aminoglycoside phosphotransferase (APT) family kinase protein
MGACPTFDEATAFVEALAELHAAGSKRASLPADWTREVGGIWYDTIEGRLSQLGALLPRFIDVIGDATDPWTLRLLTRLRGALAALASFAKSHTILHGDAHYWNGLYSGREAALLDWGNACLGPGEIDVAHAVALNLPREIGRQWELPLLESYCRRLNDLGVPRSLDDVRARYLRGVLYAITVPIGQWSAGVPAEVWRRLFENASAAARELEVELLL